MRTRWWIQLAVCIAAVVVIRSIGSFPAPVAIATPPTPPTAAELIARMTDPTVSFEGRCAAEDLLGTTPSKAALELLRPLVIQPPPQIPVCHECGTGLTRDDDKVCAIEWQIRGSVRRAWQSQMSGLFAMGEGSHIIELFGSTTSQTERSMIAWQFHDHWVPEAEAPLAAILMDPSEDIELRRGAAVALNLHADLSYHELELEIIRSLDCRDQEYWLVALTDTRHLRKNGFDPRVVQMGFDWIAEMYEESPRGYLATFLTTSLGQYVGKRFSPELEFAGYYELAQLERWRVETLNALAWWDANKARIEDEIAAMEAKSEPNSDNSQ